MSSSFSRTPRIVFFGTPDFAVPFLKALHEHYEVIAVVTQPDTPQGRKHILTASSVKQYAVEQTIPVLQPHSLKKFTEDGKKFFETFQSLSPDIAVVFAYGNILPSRVLSVPLLGCVNIHPSLLPELRGPSPIQSAILRGYNKTGVSIMLMDAQMDTGPLLSSVQLSITSTDTAATMYTKVEEVGVPLLIETLSRYVRGEITLQPQDDSRATYCSLIQKSDGEIHWNQSPQEIDQRIRALTPWPGAYTFCDSKRIKICRTHIEENQLIIDEVQPEGKRPMSYTEFLRGYPECRF